MSANPNPEINSSALRLRRQLAGLSVTDLARKVGCSTQYMSQLETGARTSCSPAVYARICDALELADRAALMRKVRAAA